MSGKRAKAVDFDGADDVMKISPTFNVTGSAVTIATWFRSDDTLAGDCYTTTDCRIFSKSLDGTAESDHYLLLNLDGPSKCLRSRLKIGGSTATFLSDCGLSELDPGKWVHGAVVYDGTDVRFYVNGVLRSTPDIISGALTTSNTARVLIGAQPNAGGVEGEYWNGAIDELRVYSRAKRRSKNPSVKQPSWSVAPE